MLSRIPTSVALTILACTSLAAGCIITGQGSTGDTGDSDRASSSSSVSASSTTGSQGGQGGVDVGAGGAGGAGVGGGSADCVLEEPTEKDEKSCDAMNITPTSAGGSASSICEEYQGEGMPNNGTAGMLPPPGYDFCVHGFSIYEPSAAAFFQSCLQMIGVEPANACDWDQAIACRDSMYVKVRDTCPTFVEETKKSCQLYADTCLESGDATMDAKTVTTCARLLTPLTNASIMALNTCIEGDPGATCIDRFFSCEAQIREGN